MADVRATVGYLASSARRPRADSEIPSRSVMPTVEVEILALDMRGASPAPSLEAEGFTLVAHRSAVEDFADARLVDQVYLPEAEALVKSATGASHAWALPRPVLRSEGHVQGHGGVIADRTAPVVHIDYSARSIPALVEAAARRRNAKAPAWNRFALYTLWRSLRPPPQDRPLALCDQRTVHQEDLVAADAIANPGALTYSAEFLMLLPGPHHRWCWFSDMLPAEALLFRQLDSAASGPSGCPHVSFALPSAGPAEPRLSIEARVCAFFDR